MKANDLAKTVIAVALSAALQGAFAAPTVEIVGTPVQNDGGDLVLTYKLTGAPAIVTFDVETNGVSIGDANVYRRCPPSGDVSKLVKTDGTYSLLWDVDAAWPARPAGVQIRAAVSAWEPSDPPDYLVASLLTPSEVRYYTSTNALPGGLLDNDDYRTSKIVMRRVPAKNVTWNMGGSVDNHAVTLPADYYFGVFPVTQAQLCRIAGLGDSQTHLALPCYFKSEGWWAKRIADNVTYNHARASGSNSVDDPGTYYPADPGENSYLGKLRAMTGVAFDLPSEAQWECVARWGISDRDIWSGAWSDGSMTVNGRVSTNGGTPGNADVDGATADGSIGCPVAGLYAPSLLGIYDLHGGVMEWCLDWYEKDISDLADGRVNAVGAVYADESGTPTARVTRGGCWFYAADSARAYNRAYSSPNDGGIYRGGGGRGMRVAASIPAESIE